MGFLKSLARGAKRLSRSAIVRGALRAGAAAATGGTSEAALKIAQRAVAVGKQIGAKQKAGRLLKEQGLAINAATNKLSAMPKLQVKGSGVEEWNVADQNSAEVRASSRKNSTGGASPKRRKAKKAPKAKAPKKKGPPLTEEKKAYLRSRPKKAKRKSTGRTLGKGMLDFKAMSKAKKESTNGQDYTWAEWRKANPIYVK